MLKCQKKMTFPPQPIPPPDTGCAIKEFRNRAALEFAKIMLESSNDYLSEKSSDYIAADAVNLADALTLRLYPKTNVTSQNTVAVRFS